MAKVVKHENLKSYFGQADHLEVSQSRSFSSLIYEMLAEKAPNNQQLKVFELILNLSIDHGPDTPSAKKVIKEAQKGETISEAVSEGIEEINDSHGGAIEPCMKVLYRLTGKGEGVGEIVQEYLETGRKLAGFGHRIYKDFDPRAQLVLKTLQENGFGGQFVKIADQLKNELNTQSGKQLPLNIDGAIAVALCAFGWDSKLGKAVFIIARTPGLCAHYLNNSQ